MPFDISQSIDGFSSALLDNKAIKWISGNPIYTALMIAISVIIIVMLIFYKYPSETFTIDLFTVGFYTFIASMFFVFVHNRHMKRPAQNDQIMVGSYQITQPMEKTMYQPPMNQPINQHMMPPMNQQNQPINQHMYMETNNVDSTLPAGNIQYNQEINSILGDY